MIHQTLAHLDTWFSEIPVEPERPMLISKLALLELCGWLEVEFDRIIFQLQSACLNDEPWVRSNVIKRTNGFKYNNHFRPMMAKIIGEHATRKIEAEINQKYPTDLILLESCTSLLWTVRCSFAHADLVNNIQTQQTFYAPSWIIKQHRDIDDILKRLEPE